MDHSTNQTTIQSLYNTLDVRNLHGFADTAIPEVSLAAACHHEPSCPQSYESGLLFILQGYKIGQANGLTFRTDKDQFVILTNTYPVLCETHTKDDQPLLGLFIRLNMEELLRLTQIMDEHKLGSLDPTFATQSVIPCPIDEALRQELDALIRILHNPADCKALGESCLTRLYYHVLQLPQGSALKALTQADSKLARVSSAMRFIEGHLNSKITVEDLAEEARLSPSAFHRAFKEATDKSPLQYLKQLRLNKAKNLMVYQNKPVYLAASEVGYDSPTQFSREFKRYFGVPPSKARELPYTELTGVL